MTIGLTLELSKKRIRKIENIFYLIKDLIFFCKRIPANFKNTVLQTVIKYGTTKDWQQMYSISVDTKDNTEKLRLIRALASSSDYQLVKLYDIKTSLFLYYRLKKLIFSINQKSLIKKVSDPSYVRTQDEG
jgi:hypothetical protein